MTCSELSRLQAIAATFSEKLTRPHPAPTGFSVEQVELEARRAAFNADLDVLFHKAGCAECKRAAELKLLHESELAAAGTVPGDYRKVA